ncbi:DNA helicase MCM9-like [Coccinella septempunctata]|uniref:DNA helicase MCM9-like n=1 Tax=Coccinella septempunctata TaxID=41139 RepID=UPI001D06CB86|nr:DNA helicase MCM9-like [Coccinella septempunctata]
MCDQFLISHHKNEIYDILKNVNDNHHFSININFIVLFDNDPSLGNRVLKEADTTLEELNKGAQHAQSILISELANNGISASTKNNVHCRVYGLPICPELHRNLFPKNCDANKFLQISGTVVRISASKLLEFKREYVCTKCKYKSMCYAEYDKKNIIFPPKQCTNPEGDCNSTNLISKDELQSQFCKDYQEIKIQEQVSQLGFGTMPSSMWVTLENDLVDSCKPGDNITICGIVKRRWSPFLVGRKIDIELAIKANHIQINNTCGLPNLVTPEIKELFSQFWETYKNIPVIGRDIILKSFCPQIFGLHIVKLAIAVVLAGGSPANQDSSTGVRTRSEPHLLLVGDPGTGKSQLLRFASKVVPRSVLTTGVVSTAAGLTVTAMMEDGEWQLEGGALVLADGGICCIDEFNSMKEHDRTSIHEAMEQQTISVAKASIVCKLSTRCSILAATNPKGNIDPLQPLCMNLALATPLLSRFDLILLIRDTVQEEWDSLVADYILKDPKENTSKFTKSEEWSLEMLQAYFTIIKKIHPPLTEEANRILASYYQLQRRQSSRNKSRTTVRLLDSLIRLSQGHARLLFHETVEVVDALTAVVLVEIGMGYQEDSVLNLNINVHSSFPDDSVENYVELLRNVLDKLNLSDILDQEMGLIQSRINLLGFGSNVRAESKYFHDRQNKDNVEIGKTNIREDENVHNADSEPQVNPEMERSIFQDENGIDDLDLNI